MQFEGMNMRYTEAIWRKGMGGWTAERPVNLNTMRIDADSRGWTAETYRDQCCQKDYSTQSTDGTTAVYFKDLHLRLIEHIQEADIVVGCVAWLTHPDILQALATKRGVSIVIQKEDFLRPDLGSSVGWKARLHRLYSALPSTLNRFDGGFGATILHELSVASDPTLPAIRCVGNTNTKRAPTMPRAHHKFVVFCRVFSEKERAEEKAEREREMRALLSTDYYTEAPPGISWFHPYAVWSGSFNFTMNAVASFENAVVLRDQKIVDAFFQEYAQVTALSEPLNWTQDWAAPEWRIGT